VTTKTCSIDGCSSPHKARGYCRRHYMLWRRHGNPLTTAAAPRGAPMAWIIDNAKHSGDACLLWPFSRLANGRAQISGGSAARVMCEIVNGPPPSDQHEAAHSCGKGHEACINPRHLRWATQVENAADKIEHGTVVQGAAHPVSKLTERDIVEIRDLAGRETQRVIAERYGMRQSSISFIINRKSWKHVA